MRNQNKGITISEPPIVPIVPLGFQSLAANMRRKYGLGSADRSQGYEDPDPDPSLSQPLLEAIVQINDARVVSTVQQKDTLIDVLASTPIE